ncbi:MAG: creatininase family protein [Candidatus Methylacidiphilales bacterium]|nr:creatininase family protein [Candidatus Methylacidiphilales bacterium]
MSLPAPLFWSERTWPEIASLRDSGMHLAVLPVGATEQHGPHLACGMDTISAQWVAEQVSARTGVPVLPALPYGCSLGHSHRWPGTLSLTPHILTDTVVSLYEWLHRAGFQRLLILNGHVTNHAPLRCSLEIIRSRWDDACIGLHSIATLSPRIQTRFAADAADWHANEAETSLMLHLAPEKVRSELLDTSDDPDRTEGLPFAFPVNRTSSNGVTGYPSRATPAAGAELARMLLEDWEALVRTALTAQPPLNHSYGTPITQDQ